MAHQTPSNADRVRLCATVHGLVQGVGFRYFTWKVANRQGCTGFVRNAADRDVVEVIVEGQVDAVHVVLAALRRGPSSARVDRVSIVWGEATGVYRRFDVSS